MPDQSGEAQVNLTVYNQGASVVHERRQIDLQRGLNQIDFADVAAQIDASSVTFRVPSEPGSVVVLEQDFLYDLTSRESMLKRYLGEMVEITLVDGTRATGQLLSRRTPPPPPSSSRPPFSPTDTDNHITILQQGGQVIVFHMGRIHDIRFPSVPGGLVTTPTLRWLVNSDHSGTSAVEVTYRTDGLSWDANYNVLLNSDGSALDVNGWITLVNNSGADFKDASVRLVSSAGQRSRPQEQTTSRFGRLPAFASRLAEQRQAPSNDSSDAPEDYFYPVGRAVTIGRDQTKQVQFVSASGVQSRIYFVYEAIGHFKGYSQNKKPNTDRGYGVNDHSDIERLLEFQTGADHKLPMNLPGGKITVYQQDDDGSAMLAGESHIQHIPEGETLRIALNKAYGLSGQRTQQDYRQLSRILLEETYEIRLNNNRNDDAVDIRVREHMFRWRNWEVLSSSHEFKQISASTAEFEVMLPPESEETITYTVRYVLPG